ncbi:D-alanine aminotransferase [mine drainage metagenome]|uniref:D-alanine aminotransferase n=1 Tax=mine drainage metagenome TaxID=410659 RepID=A0A1J5QNF0_9ZZZZ
MREPTCHLDGAWLPLHEARVPVLDRGFLFGDGVYEVIPVYARRPFRLAEHLARLRRSLRAVGIVDPLAEADWSALVQRLVEVNEPDDQCVYLQATRGAAPRRDHAFPVDVAPTVFGYSYAYPHVPLPLRESGVDAITLPDRRWLHGQIKSTSLLGAVLARQASVDAGAIETILIRDGWLTEASASNVWVVRHGELLCPPSDERKLEGVRVALFDELAQSAGVALRRREVAEWELRCADELLLSSATKEVLAVTRLDGRVVGDGRPGPVYRALYAAYQAAKQAGGRARRNTDTMMNDSRDDSPLQFPCDFPVKIMGRNVDGFADAVLAVVLRHAPDFDAASLQMRASRAGNYLSCTCTVRATSRAQLDALYLELTSHPLVKVVL